MAHDLDSGDIKAFWKKVSMIHNSKVSLPSVIDGVKGDSNIAEMWKKHYESLLNCINDFTHKDEMLQVMNDLCGSDLLVVNPTQVHSALKSSKRGKSSGLDGLASEHFIFADGAISVHLSLFIYYLYWLTKEPLVTCGPIRHASLLVYVHGVLGQKCTN